MKKGGNKVHAAISRHVESVGIKSVKPHPQNARKGKVDDIAESLTVNGQFKPIFVQKSTGHIVMGNHTYKAARQLGWKKIDVVYIECDDVQAVEIMLADNRYSDMATYDTDMLGKILKTIPDPLGTGYSPDDISAILAANEDNDMDLIVETLKPAAIEFSGSSNEEVTLDDRVDDLQDRVDLHAEAFPEDEADFRVEQAAISIAGLQDQLEPLERTFFPGNNYYNIPDLDPKMLVQDLPDKLNTWGGEDATPDDGDTTWIWNYGLASSKGLPWDRAIMSFFTYDTKFDQWWDKPAWNCARVIHNGITQAIVPDFSMWIDDPRYYHIKAAYQGNWLGRFMQEAGIRVIPRIMWCDPESIKIGVLGIPKKAPIIAVCFQAIDKKEIETQMSAEGLRTIISDLKPDCLLVYSGNPGKKLVEKAHLPKSLEVRFVNNYAAVRRHVVFDKASGKLAVDKARKKKAKALKNKKKSE